jgi:hypothetical protein
MIHGKTGLLQTFGNKRDDLLVILDNQYPHQLDSLLTIGSKHRYQNSAPYYKGSWFQRKALSPSNVQQQIYSSKDIGEITESLQN